MKVINDINHLPRQPLSAAFARRKPTEHRNCARKTSAMRLALALSVFALGANSVLSQTTGQGAISGTVADPLGAMIVNAQVKSQGNSRGRHFSAIFCQRDCFHSSPTDPGEAF
jgi:hypothetical protein